MKKVLLFSLFITGASLTMQAQSTADKIDPPKKSKCCASKAEKAKCAEMKAASTDASAQSDASADNSAAKSESAAKPACCASKAAAQETKPCSGKTVAAAKKKAEEEDLP